MTEEEKEAIEILTNVIADEVIGTYCLEIQKETNCAENCKDKDCYLFTTIETILDLIDKLQQENEELKLDQKIKGVEEEVLEEYREKINKLQKENEELKEIKEKVIEIIIEPSEDTETMFGRLVNLFKIPKREERTNYIKENYISKDTIKNKIKELIKEGDYRTKENLNGRIHFLKEDIDYKIEVLEELLGDDDINEN